MPNLPRDAVYYLHCGVSIMGVVDSVCHVNDGCSPRLCITLQDKEWEGRRYFVIKGTYDNRLNINVGDTILLTTPKYNPFPAYWWDYIIIFSEEMIEQARIEMYDSLIPKYTKRMKMYKKGLNQLEKKLTMLSEERRVLCV